MADRRVKTIEEMEWAKERLREMLARDRAAQAKREAETMDKVADAILDEFTFQE